MNIIINNDILKKDNSEIVNSEGFSFGYGVFETIKVYDKAPIFLRDHYERLVKSTKAIDINFVDSYESIEKNAEKLIYENKIQDGVLKIIVSKQKEQYNIIYTSREFIYTDKDYKIGFKLRLSSLKKNSKSLLIGIKSLNYLENILEKNRAEELDYDDVLFLNTNEKVSETAISNIFYIKDKTIITPSIESGILNGIVRQKIIRIAIESGYFMREKEFEIDELLNANEVFITNSLIGVMPIRSIENIEFDLEKYNITKLLQKEYIKLERGCL